MGAPERSMTTDLEQGPCLLVCRRLLPETEAVLATGGFPGVTAQPFCPSCRHPRLDGQPGEGVRVPAGAARGLVLVATETCLGRAGSAGLELPPHCGVHVAGQCFDLLADPPLVAALAAAGAFLLTPGWLRARSQPGGWDFAPRAASAGRLTELVLLDTGVDPGSAVRLEELADWAGLPGRTIPVGQDHYRLVLEKIVQAWRLEQLGREVAFSRERSARRVDDEAMVLDLMAKITRMGTEAEAANHILGLFEMLFAPRRVTYAALEDGAAAWCIARPIAAPEPMEVQAWLDAGFIGSRDETGFSLFLMDRDERMGVLRIEEVAFPERLEEYRRLAAPISQVCGLAISNARLYQDLHRLATTDALTGLCNRRQFFELGSRELSRARRHKRPVAALMLDIDHFKNVNDRHGHQAGDKVLAEVARNLREEVRATDICGRYGGEEFAVLIPEVELEVARQAAERIRRSIEALVIPVSGASLRVTASLGVSVMEAEDLELDELLDRSDTALYRAKQAGRNRVCAWEGPSACGTGPSGHA